MKKIFAFVLASIMVLSLVPASAFAAMGRGCELPHTLDNCEHTLVETVPAKCDQVGYQVFECDACGEQFLANFVEKPEHNWVDNQDKNADPKRENVTVTCKKDNEKNGVTYLKCKDCPATTVVTTPWQTAHKLVYVSGYGCEAKYKCSVCSRTYYGVDEKGYAKSSASHTWEFTKVVTEPEIVNGNLVPGVALYTCKVCKDTKDVQIFAPNCRCNGNQDIYCTRIVAYKAPACGVEGTNAVYQCKDCNQLYEETTKDSKNKKFAPIDKIEDAKLDALEHTPDKDGEKAGTYKCEKTFKCEYCKQVVSVCDHGGIVDGEYVAPDYVFVTEYSTADCVNYGYLVWLCNYCGDNEAVFTPPSNHATETVIVPSTCGTYGYIYTYCTNEWCTLEADTEYWKDGIRYEVGVEDEDGVLQGVKVVSLVRQTTLDPNAHDVELIASQDRTCVQPGLEVYKCKFCNLMTYNTIPALGHDYDDTKTEYKAPSCNTAGYIRKFCKNCSEYVDTPIAATPGVHNYELSERHYNCTTPTAGAYYNTKDNKWYHGYDIYSCTCGQSITVYKDVVTNNYVPQTWFENENEAELYHFGAAYLLPNGEWDYNYYNDTLVFVKHGAPSTCYTSGYDIYTCTKCQKEVYVSLEKEEHDLFKTTEKKNASCTKTGNIEYSTCYECNSNFIWVDKDGKQVPAVGSNYAQMKAAGYEQKAVSAAEIVLNMHTQNLETVTVYDCAGNILGTYEICKQVNNKKTCGKLFTDKTASTVYTGIKAADAAKHSYKTIVPYVAPTCNNQGTVGIEYCSVCEGFRVTEAYLEINETDYSKTKLTKKTYESAEKLNGVKKALTLAEVEALKLKCSDEKIEVYVGANKTVNVNTIVIEKLEHAYDAETKIYYAIATDKATSDDCSKPQFDHNYCVLCTYEYLDNYSPASSQDGHVNKYGQSLEGDCGYLETIKDRKCFYCDFEITADEMRELHTPLRDLNDPLKVDATCTTDGYTYNYCVVCNKNFDVTVEFADPDAYHAIDEKTGLPVNLDHAKKIGPDADYANNGNYYYVCDCCGKQLTKVFKEDFKGKGIEIILTADAEDYTVGSTIYVTVSIDSFQGVNVWGLDFLVKYDQYTLEFLDEETEWVTKNFNEAHDAAPQTQPVYHEATEDEKEYWTYEPTGVIKVAANARENVLVKGSQDLVVLAFKVIANARGTGIQVPAYELTYEYVPQLDREVFMGALPAVHAYDEAGKPVNCLYNDVNVDTASEFEIEAAGETLAFTFTQLLDVDGDGKGGNDLTMLDIRELYELIVYDEYSVAADTNFDGVLNFADLENAYHVFVGRITAEELAGLLPGGWFPGLGVK